MIQFDEKYRKWNDIELDGDQVDSINFLLSRQCGILGLQTGKGKTLTALVYSKIILDNFDSARVVIVCPVKAKKAWKKEMTKRLGFKSDYFGVIATDETRYDIDTNKVFLFTDTNIKKYSDIVKEIDDKGYKIVLMVDEAHGVADKKSAFSKTIQYVRNLSTICVGITATPLINQLDGLYNIVSMFCPGFLGKKTDFDNRYTIWHLENIYIKGGKKQKIKVIDGYKNLDELSERLKQVIIVRGRQYDLKFSKQFRDMTNEEHAVYEKVSSGMLSSGSEERNFSKRLHDLQRFIDRAYGEDDEMVDLAHAYGATDFSTKEEVLIDTLKAALDKDYSLIVYTSYTDTVERLNEVLKSRRIELGLGRIYNITGSVNQKDREKVEDKINKNDVVIITSAGTESINLQKCNCVIFYDIPFSSKEIIQCIGRITRVDTKHPTQYIIFCGVNDSIDEYKYALFQMHLGVVQRAINVGTNIPLADMGTDAKMIKELREKLIWKYKGDPIEKKLRKDKRLVKSKLQTATLLESESMISSNKFLIEPLESYNPDIKQVKVLYPDEEKYKDFVDGKIPFPVLRSNYLDRLRTERGKELIKKMQVGVLNSADNVVLVGNTKLPEVLMQEILDQFAV